MIIIDYFRKMQSDNKVKPFKETTSFDERQKMSRLQIERSSGMFPIICEKYKTSTLPDMDKKK